MIISVNARKELNELLETTFKGIAQGIQDVKAEMPKIGKEIVLYEGIINNLLGLFYSCVGLTVCGLISYYVNKSYPDYWGLHILTSMVALTLFVASSECFYGALKAKLAPRLFLLNYAANLIRPVSKD